MDGSLHDRTVFVVVQVALMNEAMNRGVVDEAWRGQIAGALDGFVKALVEFRDLIKNIPSPMSLDELAAEQALFKRIESLIRMPIPADHPEPLTEDVVRLLAHDGYDAGDIRRAVVSRLGLEMWEQYRTIDGRRQTNPRRRAGQSRGQRRRIVRSSPTAPTPSR